MAVPQKLNTGFHVIQQFHFGYTLKGTESRDSKLIVVCPLFAIVKKWNLKCPSTEE